MHVKPDGCLCLGVCLQTRHKPPDCVLSLEHGATAALICALCATVAAHVKNICFLASNVKD